MPVRLRECLTVLFSPHSNTSPSNHENANVWLGAELAEQGPDLTAPFDIIAACIAGIGRPHVSLSFVRSCRTA